MDQLPWDILSNVSAVAILAAAVWGVFRGWLVPKSSVEALVKVLNERLDAATSRGDEWKAVAQAANARAEERDRQTEKLMEVTSTTTRLMETLRRHAEDEGGT